MICKNCGNEILENQKFCPNCGTPAEGTKQLQQGQPTKTVQQEMQQPKNDKKTMIMISVIAAVVAVIAIVIIVVLGNGKSSDNSKKNKEIVEQTEASVVTTETITTETVTEETTEAVTEAPKKELSDDDFESFDYLYCDSIGVYYYYYIIVTNNSETAVQIDADANAYDAEGKRVAMDKGTIDVIGPGEQSIMELWFADAKDIDHVEYELSYITDGFYEPALANLSYEITQNEKNVILDVTNNGNKSAKFVHAYAVIFDAEDNILDVQDAYIVDNDSEIKPGKTVSNDIRFFDTYDHVEIYFTGKCTEW